jgi:rhodanese-related sulfurtransferase
MGREVSLQDLEGAIAAGAHVIDVREAFEFEAGHVPSARHIPLNEIPDALAQIPKGEQVWLVCKSGGRSMRACDYLEAQGFDVVSVAGGTDGWVASGREVSMEASR